MGIFSKRKKYATIAKKPADEKSDEEKKIVATPEKNEKPVKKEKKLKKSEKVWEKCVACGEVIYKKDVKDNLKICPYCNGYFKMSARERLRLLIDDGTFQELFSNVISKNPLDFPEYSEKIEIYKKKSKLDEAVVSGIGQINGMRVTISVMDFRFSGGSMGSAVGEKITRTIEKSIEEKIPAIIVSTSGGARMQEGILSLMQMVKTSAALNKLRENNLPFISIPVNPTFGGVTASFAMLGDINISEPKAIIGFTGPRVIEQTIRQKLPEGFQSSEFLLEHGMLDIISERKELKNTVHKVLTMLGF